MKAGRILPGDSAKKLSSTGKRFAVVAGTWHGVFCVRLVEGALRALTELEVNEADTTLVRVPGCFEIPLACCELAETGRYDGVIALGVLLEGETDHYRLIADEVARGLSRVMFETGVPVGFGVLTAKNVEQVAARSGAGAENKGYEAVMAVAQMVSLLFEIRS